MRNMLPICLLTMVVTQVVAEDIPNSPAGSPCLTPNLLRCLHGLSLPEADKAIDEPTRLSQKVQSIYTTTTAASAAADHGRTIVLNVRRDPMRL